MVPSKEPSASERLLQSEGFLPFVAQQMADKLPVRNLKYGLREYPSCFTGKEAVAFFLAQKYAWTVRDALRLGNSLIAMGAFSHVTGDHGLKNEALFYSFTSTADKYVPGSTGSSSVRAIRHPPQPVGFASQERAMSAQLPPVDEWQQDEPRRSRTPDIERTRSAALDAESQPSTSPPPEQRSAGIQPSGRGSRGGKTRGEMVRSSKYDLVIVGPGAHWMIGPVRAAEAGCVGRVAVVVEPGACGECPWATAAARRALAESAAAAHEARDAARLGVNVRDVEVDFGAVMRRMRDAIRRATAADAADRESGRGDVEVVSGQARFASARSVEVKGRELTFEACVIACESRGRAPEIEGLGDVPFLTPGSLFDLEGRPARLGVIGACAEGLELAQCMARFGSAVTVMGGGQEVLEGEDGQAAAAVRAQLARDGVAFRLGCRYEEVVRTAAGTIQVGVLRGGETETVEVDSLLVASGRVGSVAPLRLDRAGVEWDAITGVVVDHGLRTTNKSVFAVGCCGTPYGMRHVVDDMARKVIQSALSSSRAKGASKVIPWTVSTKPEITHVGISESALRVKGTKYRTLTKSFWDASGTGGDDRNDGFVKVYVRDGSDTILGATIVAHGAGSITAEITVALQAGLGLNSIPRVIHPDTPCPGAALERAGSMDKKSLAKAAKYVFGKLSRGRS